MPATGDHLQHLHKGSKKISHEGAHKNLWAQISIRDKLSYHTSTSIWLLFDACRHSTTLVLTLCVFSFDQSHQPPHPGRQLACGNLKTQLICCKLCHLIMLFMCNLLHVQIVCQWECVCRRENGSGLWILVSCIYLQFLASSSRTNKCVCVLWVYIMCVCVVHVQKVHI